MSLQKTGKKLLSGVISALLLAQLGAGAFGVVAAEAAPTPASIRAALSLADDFAVFALTFNNNNHMEGNVAVQTLTGCASQLGNTANVYSGTAPYTVTVHKTATGAGKEGTFRFALYDGDIRLTQDTAGAPIGTDGVFTVSTDAAGAGSTVLNNRLNSTKAYTVYELDDAGERITTGSGTVNGATAQVSVADAGGFAGGSVASSSDTSYIEFLAGGAGYVSGVNMFNQASAKVVLGQSNLVHYINANQKEAVGADGSRFILNTDNFKIVSGAFPIDFAQEFTKLTALCTQLANAKSTDDLLVVTTALPQNGVWNAADFGLPANTDQNYLKDTGVDITGKTLVLNIDLTGVSGATAQVPKLAVRSDGVSYNGAAWNNVYKRVLYNFVQSNGAGGYEPYNGAATITAQEMLSGTVLAPCAAVNAEKGMNGSLIAKAAEHSSGEIHKITVQETEMAELTFTNVFDEKEEENSSTTSSDTSSSDTSSDTSSSNTSSGDTSSSDTSSSDTSSSDTSSSSTSSSDTSSSNTSSSDTSSSSTSSSNASSSSTSSSGTSGSGTSSSTPAPVTPTPTPKDPTPATPTPATPAPVTPRPTYPVGETIEDDDAPLGSASLNIAKIFALLKLKVVPKTADTGFSVPLLLALMSAGILGTATATVLVRSRKKH